MPARTLCKPSPGLPVLKSQQPHSGQTQRILPLAKFAVQAIFQGIVVTIVALLLYSRAVAILGASGAAAFGALVPALFAKPRLSSSLRRSLVRCRRCFQEVEFISCETKTGDGKGDRKRAAC